MPGRNYSASSSYRYGFNGKEQDPEMYGQGNEYDYGDRIYNPRIGRWFSTDPVNKPWLSLYQFGANNPINNIDADGSDEIHFHTYKVMARRPDGVIVGQVHSSTIIIKDNGPDKYFFHTHFTRIETPGKFSKGGSSTNERTIEFYPWRDNSRSGITGTSVFGFITNRYWGGDRDYVTLIKLIDENPEVQSYIEAKIKDKKWDWNDEDYKQILKDAPKYQTLENIKRGAELTAAAVSVLDGGLSIIDLSSASKLKGVVDVDEFISSATTQNKNGLTEVGRALQKHAGRAGSSFEDIKFSHKTGDQQGLDILDEILNSSDQSIDNVPNGTKTIFDNKTGRGVNISRSGKFNGFRDIKDKK